MPWVIGEDKIDAYNIYRGNGWVDSEKFNCRGRILNIETYWGSKKCEIISKKERRFSVAWIVGRVGLGVLLAAVTCGLSVLLSKSVRNLFTKTKETVRLAKPIGDSTPEQLGKPIGDSTPEQLGKVIGTLIFNSTPLGMMKCILEALEKKQ